MRKKLSAILLLALFLFNMAGYKVLFYYLQQAADQQMIASLDKVEYNEADLITLRIPISLPYQNDWTDFERVDGEIDYGGIIYKYVKRKVCNGELILLCLPDEKRTEMASAKDAFFKFANDLMHHGDNKIPANQKTVDYHPLTDYQTQSITFILSAGFQFVEKHSLIQPPGKLQTTPHLSPEHPPQV